jgi:hypothetical protein
MFTANLIGNHQSPPSGASINAAIPYYICAFRPQTDKARRRGGRRQVQLLSVIVCGYLESATRPMVKESWKNEGQR